MQNKLDACWDSLKPDHIDSVFQLYDIAHPLDFYVGKAGSGQRLLLLLTDEAPPATKDMRFVSIQVTKRQDEKWALLLTLNAEALAPMFSLLCSDLIESSREINNAANALNFVLRRLTNWRRLMARGLPTLLSENEIRGLCGELLFLRCLIAAYDKPTAVSAWVGPNLAEQDFQMPDIAWEVKTTRPKADAVTITSATQLQTTTRPIQLVVYALADGLATSPGSFTLFSLVEQLRTALGADHDTSVLFEERLANTGYIARSEYNEQLYVESTMTVFEVRGSFPRITPDLINPAIISVKYDLLLSACAEFGITPPQPIQQRAN